MPEAGFISSTEAKRFHVGDNAPTVRDFNSRGQWGLSSIGDTVADLFEEHALREGLDLYASQVCRKGMKALPHGSVAIMIFSVALRTIGEIEGLAQFDSI